MVVATLESQDSSRQPLRLSPLSKICTLGPHEGIVAEAKQTAPEIMKRAISRRAMRVTGPAEFALRMLARLPGVENMQTPFALRRATGKIIRSVEYSTDKGTYRIQGY